MFMFLYRICFRLYLPIDFFVLFFFSMLLGGILPFGAVFIELFFILTVCHLTHSIIEYSNFLLISNPNKFLCSLLCNRKYMGEH